MPLNTPIAVGNYLGQLASTAHAADRRELYALTARCSDLEAGDLARAIATTLYNAGIRETAEEEARLAAPVLVVVPPNDAFPWDRDDAVNDAGTLPPSDPGAPVVLEPVPGGVVVTLTPASSPEVASSPTEPPPRDGVA